MKIRTLLSKDEAKKLMHTRLKPIIVKRNSIGFSNIFGIANVNFTGYMGWALMSFISILVCAQLIVEAHGSIANSGLQPFINTGQLGSTTMELPSTGNIRMPVIKQYDPNEKNIRNSLGNKKIRVNDKSIVRYDLPDEYYSNINFSLFKTLAYYNSPAAGKKNSGVNLIQGEKLYTDDVGFIRHMPGKDQLVIDNQPDYVISNDMFSQKDINGNRYLVVTNTGMYTIITDDEKEDFHYETRGTYTPRFSGLTGDDTTERVYNFFRSRGCSHEAAIGILANMQQESGIDPTRCRDDETAKGIVQWKDGRFNQLAEFAGRHGRDWTDLESQLEFLWVELNTSDMNDRMRGSVASQNLTALGVYGHPQGFEGFKNTDDARYATALFEGSFERSGGSAMQSRYRAIYALDEKLKNKETKKSGLLKWLANQESGNVQTALFKTEEDNSNSVKVLQSRILCIYRID